MVALQRSDTCLGRRVSLLVENCRAHWTKEHFMCILTFMCAFVYQDKRHFMTRALYDETASVTSRCSPLYASTAMALPFLGADFGRHTKRVSASEGPRWRFLELRIACS